MTRLSGLSLLVSPAIALPMGVMAASEMHEIYEAASPRESLLQLMGDRAVAAGLARSTLPRALLQRERLHPTGIPTAIPCALPHTDASHVLAPAIGIAVLPEPIEFVEMGSAAKLVSASLVVMILVKNSLDQVDALQAILRAVGNAESLELLRDAETPEALAETFNSLVNGQ